MYKEKDSFRKLFNMISCSKKIKHEEFNQNDCYICKQKNSIQYNGESLICVNCGVFHSDKISDEPEWRYYGFSDTKSSNPIRVGLPTNKLLPVSSLGTNIAYNRNYSFNKIKLYHKWNSMPYKERSLWQIFSKITVKSKMAGIPSIIINEAKEMYAELSETKISRGSNRKGLEAACIYMSCKNYKVPRSTKEIADIFDLDISDMTKGVKKCQEIRKLSKSKKFKKFKVKATNPLDYIERFCSNLKLSDDLKNICVYVSCKANKLDIVDENTPPSIAAGSIFLVSMVCNLSITKKKIGDACKISEVTISKCFKKLYMYRSYLFSDEIKNKYNLKF